MIMFKLFVYAISPIDHWGGWRRLDEAMLAAPPDAWTRSSYTWQFGPTFEDLNTRLEIAKKLARKRGWEGDIREGPYWVPLPIDEPGVYDFMIAWKQDNNGTCFVVLPFPLPWLAKDEPVPIFFTTVFERAWKHRHRTALAAHRREEGVGGCLTAAVAAGESAARLVEALAAGEDPPSNASSTMYLDPGVAGELRTARAALAKLEAELKAANDRLDRCRAGVARCAVAVLTDRGAELAGADHPGALSARPGADRPPSARRDRLEGAIRCAVRAASSVGLILTARRAGQQGG
jgi:hypothetical protein